MKNLYDVEIGDFVIAETCSHAKYILKVVKKTKTLIEASNPSTQYCGTFYIEDGSEKTRDRFKSTIRVPKKGELEEMDVILKKRRMIHKMKLPSVFEKCSISDIEKIQEIYNSL